MGVHRPTTSTSSYARALRAPIAGIWSLLATGSALTPQESLPEAAAQSQSALLGRVRRALSGLATGAAVIWLAGCSVPTPRRARGSTTASGPRSRPSGRSVRPSRESCWPRSTDVSASRRRQNRSSLLRYGEARDELIERIPQLRWAVYRAEDPELLMLRPPWAVVQARIPEPLWFKDRYLAVQLYRQGYWEAFDGQNPDVAATKGDTVSDPWKSGLFGYVDRCDSFRITVDGFSEFTEDTYLPGGDPRGCARCGGEDLQGRDLRRAAARRRDPRGLRSAGPQRRREARARANSSSRNSTSISTSRRAGGGPQVVAAVEGIGLDDCAARLLHVPAHVVSPRERDRDLGVPLRVEDRGRRSSTRTTPRRAPKIGSSSRGWSRTCTFQRSGPAEGRSPSRPPWSPVPASVRTHRRRPRRPPAPRLEREPPRRRRRPSPAGALAPPSPARRCRRPRPR